ncbi:STAS domain-containing protein [Streptomyces sp. NRRL S-350]|uniref:STAS domain-containing protein n=1 Tax=Streptomyces sp. NRRL S-350 TaxID=1463902 RepID=UPI000691357D|nr:STAS domain-containing protein [Streptomyces sp. NRRL S-350]
MSREGLEQLASALAERVGASCDEADHAVQVDPLRRQVRRAVTGIDAYLTAVETGSCTASGLHEQALGLWQGLERLAAAWSGAPAAHGTPRSEARVPAQKEHRSGGGEGGGEVVTVLPCLTSETRRVGDVLVCSFAGDLTMDSEAAARHALQAALDRRPAVLAVDLEAVELFTSSGLNLLLAMRGAAREEQVPLVLIAPSPMTRRVLELTETAELFPVHATAEDAARGPLPQAPLA